MPTVVITGSRDWKKRGCYRKMYDRLRRLPKKTRLVHGNCRGADKMAGRIGKSLGFPEIESYPAEWNKYGHEAGNLRNHRMLVDEQPDLVLAFHENIAVSKGTKDCIQRAQELAIDWELIE